MIPRIDRRCHIVLFPMIIALLIIGSSVMEYHHHNEDGTLCLCLGDCPHHHSGHSDCDQAECSLHLDYFQISKSVDLNTPHVQEPITISIYNLYRETYDEAWIEIEFPHLQYMPAAGHHACRGLRAPPFVGLL